MPRTRRKFTKERPPDPDALDATQRVIVACPLPNGFRLALDRLIGQLEAADLPIRWIASSSSLLTLLPIGEVAPETVEILRLGLPPRLTGLTQVRLAVGAAGASPSIERPDVVWLGLTGDLTGLLTLRRRVITTLAGLSFELEIESFKYTIVLGRSRQPLSNAQRDTLQRLLKTERLRAEVPPALLGPIDLTEIQLIRVTLDKDGATHTPIQSYPLVARPPEPDPEPEAIPDPAADAEAIAP